MRVSHLGQIFCHPFLFLTFFHSLHFSILPPKYQSQMTNPQGFLTAWMTSSRLSKFALHVVKKYTCTLLLHFLKVSETEYVGVVLLRRVENVFKRQDLFAKGEKLSSVIKWSYLNLFFCFFIIHFYLIVFFAWSRILKI